jgi:hypothetical protein
LIYLFLILVGILCLWYFRNEANDKAEADEEKFWLENKNREMDWTKANPEAAKVWAKAWDETQALAAEAMDEANAGTRERDPDLIASMERSISREEAEATTDEYYADQAQASAEDRRIWARGQSGRDAHKDNTIARVLEAAEAEAKSCRARAEESRAKAVNSKTRYDVAKKLAALAKANPEAARAQVWAEIVRVKAAGARNLAENIRSRVTWAEANSEAARDQAATARAQAINNYVNLDLDLHFWDRQKKYAALAKVDDATMNLEDTSKNAEAQALAAEARAEAARKYADWAEANPVAARARAEVRAEAEAAMARRTQVRA